MTTPQPPEESSSPVEHDLMLPPEVADYFRVSEFTVKNWLNDPKKQVLPRAFMLGGAWRIPRTDVVDLARRMSEGYVVPDLKKGRGRK